MVEVMRERKYRIYDKKTGGMEYLGLLEVSQFFNTCTDEYIKNFIVMEWTGLFDRGKKEIYEGDIVEKNFIIGGICKLQVKWVNAYAGFFIGNKHGTFSIANENELTIVGNVFENPDLVSSRKRS